MLTDPTTVALFALLLPNITALVAVYIKISTRLTRIETDIAWIIRNCRMCPKDQTWHSPD